MYVYYFTHKPNHRFERRHRQNFSVGTRRMFMERINGSIMGRYNIRVKRVRQRDGHMFSSSEYRAGENCSLFHSRTNIFAHPERYDIRHYCATRHDWEIHPYHHETRDGFRNCHGQSYRADVLLRYAGNIEGRTWLEFCFCRVVWSLLGHTNNLLRYDDT